MTAPIWMAAPDDRVSAAAVLTTPRLDALPDRRGGDAQADHGSNHQQLGQTATTARPTRTAAACAPHR